LNKECPRVVQSSLTRAIVCALLAATAVDKTRGNKPLSPPGSPTLPPAAVPAVSAAMLASFSSFCHLRSTPQGCTGTRDGHDFRQCSVSFSLHLSLSLSFSLSLCLSLPTCSLCCVVWGARYEMSGEHTISHPRRDGTPSAPK